VCRILALCAGAGLDLAPWMRSFRSVCATSKEYQGHGWGVAWIEGGEWRRHRSLDPIWEDSFVPPPSQLALVHARSAFQNRNIEVENNMPFLGERFAFGFNGELRGVRLRTPGETGAARLHALTERFGLEEATDPARVLQRLDAVTQARSAYVRALNVVICDGRALYAHCRFGEDPDYFTLHRAKLAGVGRGEVICSEPLVDLEVETKWRPFENGETYRTQEVSPCS